MAHNASGNPQNSSAAGSIDHEETTGSRRIVSNWGREIFIRFGALPFVLVAIVVIFAIWEPRFLSGGNIFNVSRASTYLIMVTLAQMICLLTAGLDLSIGGAITLISVVGSSAMVALAPLGGYGILVGFLVGIGVGVGVGAFNGFCTAFFRISPFLVTLGTMSVTHGITLILSRGGNPVFGIPKAFVSIFGVGRTWGIPNPVLVTAALIALVYFVLYWTRFGRYIYALGGNPEAAFVMGIPVAWYTFLAYTFAGGLVGLTGMMLTARVGSGEPTLGLEMPLLSIAAAVLGGISLFGGEGKLYGAVLGAITIMLLRNGMDILNISSFVQMVAMGLILIGVVAADRYRRTLV
jgi:ribose transport system permease protein